MAITLASIPGWIFVAITGVAAVLGLIFLHFKAGQERKVKHIEMLLANAPIFKKECDLENTESLNQNGARRQAILKKVRNKLERGVSVDVSFDWKNRKNITIEDYGVIGNIPPYIYTDLNKFGYTESTHTLKLEFVRIYDYVNEAGKTCLGCRVSITSHWVIPPPQCPTPPLPSSVPLNNPQRN